MSGIADPAAPALRRMRMGDLGGARREAERAVGANPDNASLLQLLGIICCRAGDPREGADHLRRALTLDPADPATRLNLANVLVALGRLDEAEAISREGGQPALLRLRGYVLQGLGRNAEAAACYEKVVAADPRDFEIWNNLGNARRENGDLDGAAAALERARALRPDLPAVHFNLGLGLSQAGRLEEGVAAFAEALRRGPQTPEALFEMGKALRLLGRHEEALASLDRAAALARGTADVHLERGRALAGLQRFGLAEAAYQDALAAQPGLAAAFLERGILLERENRLDRLGALLDEAEAQGGPRGDLAYLHALALEREGKREEALAEARAAPPLEGVRRAQLIGRLADRLGDAAAAFAAYGEMNRLVAEEQPKARDEAAGYRAHVRALANMLTPDYAAAWSAAEPRRERPAPAFLVGFPRSGTTLLDTMLMGHDGIHVLEEVPILDRVGKALGDFARLPTLGKDETERLRALYFAELDALGPVLPGRLVIDKLPLNMLGAPLIHRLFPEAKFIFAQRHPCDVVLSCFMQNFELNGAMANFLDLEDAAALYDLVLGFWTRCGEMLPLDVHALRYEDLVADQAGQMRALLDFLGLAWDGKVLDHQGTAARRGLIVTPSYNQVAQPIYTRSLGRWWRYGAHLAPILPILKPWAEHMGYDE
jgi:tetratricopeptide (TPR) repeat protein